jgi:colanic acid biosynthesis glycosyl transferase WcaI
LKILIHDYPGHAFPVQLARMLARRGHQVRYVYAAYFASPRGPLAARPDDPAGLAIVKLGEGVRFAKYDYLRRFIQERRYASSLAGEIASFAPDLVLANGPLDILIRAEKAAHAAGARYVAWLQDFYSMAIDRHFRARLPVLGALIGAIYLTRERALLRRADRVVAITADFVPILAGWGVDQARIDVIENWAPAGEITPAPRDNAWSRTHGLTSAATFLYSGTLGLKHNPALLLALARRVRGRGGRVVVISEGPGADWLRAQSADNLMVLGFQPFERLSEVLASADVLVAILEPDAGIFSVPSKVLTYFCAGRPLLAAIPAANLASRLIGRENAGLVTAPDDETGLLAAAERLIDDPALRETLGHNALDYAARTFDSAAIADRFEQVFQRATR